MTIRRRDSRIVFAPLLAYLLATTWPAQAEHARGSHKTEKPPVVLPPLLGPPTVYHTATPPRPLGLPHCFSHRTSTPRLLVMLPSLSGSPVVCAALATTPMPPDCLHCLGHCPPVSRSPIVLPSTRATKAT